MAPAEVVFAQPWRIAAIPIRKMILICFLKRVSMFDPVREAAIISNMLNLCCLFVVFYLKPACWL